MFPMNLHRLWFYFRTGYGSYVSLALGVIQFLLIGALYIQRIPELSSLHFSELIALFMVPFIAVSIVMGLLHTRHQMRTDTMLSALQNPFMFRIAPGKEEKISIPMTILGLKVQRLFLEQLGIMTKELELEFDGLGELLNRLSSGEEIR